MSEVAPNLCPLYCRPLPAKAANDEINGIFRAALREAVSSAKAVPHATRDEYVHAVIYNFYLKLGTGVIDTEIETMSQELPDAFVAHIPRSETALKFPDRADGRSYSDPRVLSPIITLFSKDSAAPCEVGTDKLGHLVQQGYDYWVINKRIEPDHKGLGPLFASAWGYWSEGEEISEEKIAAYLKSHNLPADENEVRQIKEELAAFVRHSETIKIMSPLPEFAKSSEFLRNLGHFLGVQQFGMLGLSSTGIISYADLAANEAGLKFYLDLEKDPDYAAEHFDIKDYVTSEWDEEILKSKYAPKIQEKIDAALRDEIKLPFVYGLGFNLNVLDQSLAVTAPLIFYPSENFELRLRAGVETPLNFARPKFYEDIEATSALDFDLRITGLHYIHLSAMADATSQIFEGSPLDAIHPSFEAGYEIMLLGWVSFQVGAIYDVRSESPSAEVGTLMLWR